MRPSLVRLVAVAALLVAGQAAGHPGPKVLDAVVASVGQRPILWSEVLGRALPSLQELSPDKRAAARDRILAQSLERLIEERLIEVDAALLRITIEPHEVDDGLARIRQDNHLTDAELAQELAKRGLSQQDYRDEIRRQILEQKWTQRRLVPAMTGSVTQAEARKSRLEQLRADVDVEVRK
ncbi:MAG: SurA N-terminal domain-containing protein [Labilithrix sp.]|nr:SurA N-terminal domain-containing protein [Labilithrix sp.]MCW5810767.1 SurA N-terminal domain-containing protein [Labilithrix sp.]